MRFKVLFIMLIGLISMTGLQANTLDLKKNSKTEFAKQFDVGIEMVSVTNQNDVIIVAFQNPVVQSDSDIGYVHTDKVYNITTSASKQKRQKLINHDVAKLPDNIREIDKSQQINKNVAITNRNCKNLYRLSRDGFSC